MVRLQRQPYLARSNPGTNELLLSGKEHFWSYRSCSFMHSPCTPINFHLLIFFFVQKLSIIFLTTNTHVTFIYNLRLILQKNVLIYQRLHWSATWRKTEQGKSYMKPLSGKGRNIILWLICMENNWSVPKLSIFHLNLPKLLCEREGRTHNFGQVSLQIFVHIFSSVRSKHYCKGANLQHAPVHCEFSCRLQIE